MAEDSNQQNELRTGQASRNGSPKAGPVTAARLDAMSVEDLTDGDSNNFWAC